MNNIVQVTPRKSQIALRAISSKRATILNDRRFLQPKEKMQYEAHVALRGAFSDYRAGREDVLQDKEDQDTLIGCPTLVLWGEDFA